MLGLNPRGGSAEPPHCWPPRGVAAGGGRRSCAARFGPWRPPPAFRLKCPTGDAGRILGEPERRALTPNQPRPAQRATNRRPDPRATNGNPFPLSPGGLRRIARLVLQRGATSVFHPPGTPGNGVCEQRDDTLDKRLFRRGRLATDSPRARSPPSASTTQTSARDARQARVRSGREGRRATLAPRDVAPPATRRSSTLRRTAARDLHARAWLA
jgi:hypothetical protein